jgi:hypothetical protein
MNFNATIEDIGKAWCREGIVGTEDKNRKEMGRYFSTGQ